MARASRVPARLSRPGQAPLIWSNQDMSQIALSCPSPRVPDDVRQVVSIFAAISTSHCVTVGLNYQPHGERLALYHRLD